MISVTNILIKYASWIASQNSGSISLKENSYRTYRLSTEEAITANISVTTRRIILVIGIFNIPTLMSFNFFTVSSSAFYICSIIFCLNKENIMENFAAFPAVIKIN